MASFYCESDHLQSNTPSCALCSGRAVNQAGIRSSRPKVQGCWRTVFNHTGTKFRVLPEVEHIVLCGFVYSPRICTGVKLLTHERHLAKLRRTMKPKRAASAHGWIGIADVRHTAHTVTASGRQVVWDSAKTTRSVRTIGRHAKFGDNQSRICGKDVKWPDSPVFIYKCFN